MELKSIFPYPCRWGNVLVLVRKEEQEYLLCEFRTHRDIFFAVETISRAIAKYKDEYAGFECFIKHVYRNELGAKDQFTVYSLEEWAKLSQNNV